MKKVIMFSGQGSQHRGMGKELFPKYKAETKIASDILGYDLEELCVEDPDWQLTKTQFTQPAVYVVNALHYYEKEKEGAPNYLLGHSLGEYNALHAAGAFDFETGLQLVKKRGEIMAGISGGGMAAVLGLDFHTLEDKLKEGGFTTIEIANYNAPTQTVIAGPEDAIYSVVKYFTGLGIKVVPLFITAASHSSYMESVSDMFHDFLKDFRFLPLNIPVISNATALPYGRSQVAALLSRQLSMPVQWIKTIHYLLGHGVANFEEVRGQRLAKMISEIKSSYLPAENEKITKV